MPRPLPLLLTVFIVSGACERAPAEPQVRAPTVPGAPGSPPTLAEAARRLGAALDAAVGEVVPVGAPAPPGARVVGFTRGGMPAAALVDADRAYVGRDGAERALAMWSARGETPDPGTLARTVGALVYPGAAVLTGAEARAPDGSTGERGPRPALVSHPGGGRVLTFSIVIPEGGRGAGLHVARWRWTDSGLLIEASPHPERR
ncbi:MAG: hypothetical protein Q8S73_16945 [Deltaproteobacteria bacterium]|nr:hypothetical protein [Myxococcales bacterium]MDP3215797.1 hypothetical protein [Deltaproteobacteria bacterium]